MRASLLEMMSFAIVALALVGPKLILWLMVNERPAPAKDKLASTSSRRAGAMRVPAPGL
jgi:hypothetical protein